MKSLSLALAALMIAAAWTSNAFAQQRAPAGTLVAVIDIGSVFEVHPDFKAKMEALKQRARDLETQLSSQQKELSNRSKALKEYDASSPEYQRLEADLARQLADLQVKARQQQKEIVEQEARQYYETYNQLLASVERVASTYGIGLVLRFDSRAIDPDSPQSIALGMNRDVVFQRNLDITDLVKADLGIDTHELPGESPTAGRTSTTRR